MKFNEFLDADDRRNPGQSDKDILFEMSNFSARTTGLPNGIDVWCRTDPLDHGHTRYRIKITKDRYWAAIYSVGAEPKLVKNVNDSLTDGENSEIIKWIQTYSSLIIGLIDGKIDSGEFTIEIQKLRGKL